MDVQAWYGSIPPEDAGAGVDAWCWTWAVQFSPVVRARYSGDLPPEHFAPDILSGVHVSGDADLASCTPDALRRAGLAEETAARIAPYCGLAGEQALHALRKAPLRLSPEEARAIDAAWRICHGC